ncbi:MAG: endonuclease [Micromonosporaceae bacterium]
MLVVGLVATLFSPASASSAAATLTVSQAIATQNGSSQTVHGYVVGQPTATNTVVKSNFPNDYALALADSPSETNTGRMLYVQITSQWRSTYGLQSNPSRLGDQLDVTGQLTAYFSHPGLTNPTAFSGGGSEPPPDDYYAPAIGKTGDALRSALHGIIDNNTMLSYDQVWTALKDTDQDPNNTANVVLLYSGFSRSKSLNGGDPDDWNREHTWAQSHGGFGTTPGPGTDVHHLRPTDVTVNSTRGNKDFDLGGSAVSECPDCFTDSDSFEPRDAVKGDVARMLFYMAIRYEGGDGYPDLELNNLINGSVPYHGKLSVLLNWHAADPPSAFEKRRNDRIYDVWQGNRNPFIDHPEWASSIWN